METKLMDIKEVAEYLKMNKMTVYKLARQGKIPAFKVASEWRFRKDLIDKSLMGQLKGKDEVEGFETEPKLETGATILVVDDDEVIRDFFARILKGYRVLTAIDGNEALNTIKKDRPDLVLLDIKMPGMDGIETLKQIKQIDKNIAVIMLSAYGTLETNLEAARIGAHTSIAKPFDLRDIKSAIKNALLNEDRSEEKVPPFKKYRKRKKK